MNELERIRHVLRVLEMIETAALKMPPSYTVSGDAEVYARNQARIDNAVRIYCYE